ncbi:MAG: hypothetical protein P8186_15060 [Anaerolineae bacterium]
MAIEIRPIRTKDEYRAVEQLQRQVWGLEDAEIVPDHLLLTAQKNGGLVLGAFDISPGGEDEQLVGFVFGFAGLSPAGRLKHCSHMTGVAPAYQNRRLGYRLKLAQREHVLAQGIDLITWTFDPLESRNASLNFHKLGATCQTYLRDLYGSMRDALNVGLPTDRFQVEWSIDSEGRELSPHSRSATWSLAMCHSRPPQISLPIQGDRLLIQIPAYFQAIKATHIELARAWRLHTRVLFEAAFAGGYVVTDLLFAEGQSCYLLEKDWTPL